MRSKTRSNESSQRTERVQGTSRVTPTLASFVSQPMQDLVGQFATEMGRDSNYVAPVNSILSGALGRAGSGSGAGADLVRSAATAGPVTMQRAQLGGPAAMPEAAQVQAASFGGPAQASFDVKRFENPYLDAVVSSLESDITEREGAQRAGLTSRLAGSGALRGGRAGLAMGQLEGELARARDSALSGVRERGFQQAAGLARDYGLNEASRADQFAIAQAQAENAARQANAAARNQFALAQYGTENDFTRTQFAADQESNRFDASALADALSRRMQGGQILGDMGRADTAQALQAGQIQQGLDQQQAEAPLSRLRNLAQLLGYDPSLFAGQEGFEDTTSNMTGNTTGTQSSSGSPLNAIMGLASLFRGRR